MTTRMIRAGLIAALLVIATGAQAQDALPAKAKAELDVAWGAAEKVAVRGPSNVKLLDQASIRLAPDELFIPAAPTNRIMVAISSRRAGR